MCIRRACIALVFLKVILAKSLDQNETSILSTYAKVANFGGGTPSVDEGRSSGMSLYTQSSNAKIISGQNLKNRVPHYSLKPSRISQSVSDIFPAMGEVQERFNPRPYFDYLHVQPKKHQTSSGSSKTSPVYGAPTFDSFPVFRGSDPPASDTAPPRDPKPSEANMNPDDSYSPSFASRTPMMSENGAKAADNSMMYPMDSYQPTKEGNSESSSTGNEYPGFPYAPQQDMSPNEQTMPPNNAPTMETSNMGQEMESMEKDPGKYHHYPHNQYQDVGPKIVNTVRPPGSDEMMYPNHYGHEEAPSDDNGGMDKPMSDSTAMDMPKEMPNMYPKLPEYLDHEPKEHGYHYPDFYHYDHHPVYHEITTTTTTTTTTEEPEERVNNNYSYYYLGRKLWYIPLYFSAYFIIYITVLILKSIARHKVNFWHDLHNLGSRRQGRNLKLEEITRNVTRSIETAQAKYMM